MTAHVLAVQADAPGKARKTMILGQAAGRSQVAVYNLQFGTDVYAANGVSISDIWLDFKEIYYIGIEQKDTNTAADQRKFAIDYTAQKILVYTAFNTEDSGNDISVVGLRLLVVGSH